MLKSFISPISQNYFDELVIKAQSSPRISLINFFPHSWRLLQLINYSDKFANTFYIIYAVV